MKSKALLFRLLISLLIPAAGLSGVDTRSGTLPRSTAEAQGVSSPALLKLIRVLDESPHEMHSFMLVRHGRVVAEGWWSPYRPDLKHTMYSVSKSWTSTAIGLAVQEKRLRLEDKVISFFPNQQPDPLPPRLANLTLKDLLTMSVGQDPDPTFRIIKTRDWESAFLQTPILAEPGTVFLYNSLGTYMLSSILTQVTGDKVVDYLKPRLFTPLGISDVDWETAPGGANTGGWGLRLRTEDMAKLGQLYLQDGSWNGRHVLSPKWVEEATSAQIIQSPKASQEERDRNDWLQGYGFQFWRSRHGAFRADGAFGQYILVLPDQDAVVAITSETSNMQGVLNLLWEHLLPALHEKKLPENKSGWQELQDHLQALALPMPSKGNLPTLAREWSGQSYTLEPNDLGLTSITFHFEEPEAKAVLHVGETRHPFLMGRDKWALLTTLRPGPSLTANAVNSQKDLAPFKVASACGWQSADTLEWILRYIEGPHSERFEATFQGDHITLRTRSSLAPNDVSAIKGSR